MVSVDRAWNTWDANIPSSIVHLSSGFEIRVSVYDGDLGVLEDFHDSLTRGESSIELGAHLTNGEFIEFTLVHGGAHVDVAVAKPNPFVLAGTVRFRETTQWNAHRWINFEVGYASEHGAHREPSPISVLDQGSHEVRFAYHQSPDADSGIPMIASRWRSQEFRVGVSQRPTHSDLYGNLNELREDYQVRGSGFVRAPGDGSTSWGAFRFNVEGVSSFDFAVAQDIDGRRAEDTVRSTLSNAVELIDTARLKTETGAEPFRAVRDVIGWNTVWEREGGRAYTCLTRNWMKMLGGRGVWLTDVMYNGLLSAAVGDWDLATANLDAVLSGQQANGIVPGLMAGNAEWVDRTQFPVLSYIVWRTYLMTQDKASLERFYPVLRRYQNWLYTNRDGNGNGILEHGTDRVGLATNAGSRWAAINESGMDNLPVFDEARFIEETGTLDFEEVGHNSMLVLGIEMLSNIAAELGLREDAAELRSEHDRLSRLVGDRLWDDERQIFAGRLWSGDFAHHLSPTSFYPLVAGIATEEQAKIIIEQHLLNPEEFWGEMVLPTVPYNDPTSRDNAYWRGRVWPPLNFMVWDGLRRYGYFEEARELANRSWKMFDQAWSERRHAHENFQIVPVDDCDWPDSDQFYSWGAMMPLMEMFESAEVSPWLGTVLAPSDDSAMIRSPGSELELRLDRSANEMMLVKNGIALCSINVSGRLEQISVGDDRITFSIPQVFITRPLEIKILGRQRVDVLGAYVNARAVEASDRGEDTLIAIDANSEDIYVELFLRARKGEA